MATCPICFEEIQEKASPDSCDHVFCLTCLEKWSKLGTFCPVDRKRYTKIVNLESDCLIKVKSRKRKKLRAVYDFSARCEVCEDETSPDVLLLCDCCDLAYHIYCLAPPLKAIPAGLWFCPTCTSVEQRLREKNGINKEVEVDLGNSKLLFQKNRRRKEKFAEVSPTKHGILPSCSGVSDRSIKGTFQTLISHLYVDPCEVDPFEVVTHQNDLTKEKIFSVFDRIEGAGAPPNNSFDRSAKSCVPASSNLNLSHCFSCQDAIIAASQNYCKICKLKFSINSAATEKEEKYSDRLRYSQAFESSCNLRKGIRGKKMNSQRNTSKNRKKVLERRHRSLIHVLRKIRDSQKI